MENREFQMDKEEARVLLLYLLSELKKVCAISGIPYYGYAGTLLGAIRHSGIIPWDDDIDVIIERRYYDEFVEACEKYLEKPVIIHTRENDPLYCQEYIKLCFEDDIYGFSDISIDVFIVDNTDPKKKLMRAIQNQFVQWLYPIKLYKVSRIKQGEKYTPKNPFKYFLLALCSFLSIKMIDRIHKKIMTAEKKDTGYFVNWGSHYNYKKVTYLRSDWGKPQRIPFENTYINAPENIEATIVPLYGENYMTPPPVEKRINHGLRKLHCAKLDYNKVKDLVENHEQI